MTIHIDRDPEPMTPEPTEQTLRAQHVLESLDSMRTSGATIGDQVRYLNQNLPSTPEMVEEPSTISEQLALQERLKGEFSRLRQAMVGLMTTWNTPDILPDDVRSAGYRLLKHLDSMRQAAEEDLTKNWKSEIGMLSEVWESAPDVSDVFGTVSPRPHNLHKASTSDEKVLIRKAIVHVKEPRPYVPHVMEKFKKAVDTPEFAEKVTEALNKSNERSKEKAEARRVPHKVLHEPLSNNLISNDEAKTPFAEVYAEACAREAHQAALANPKKLVKEQDERLSHDQKLVKELENPNTIVGDPSKIKLKTPQTEVPLERATQLTIETWTDALNELAIPRTFAENHEWTFDNELQGTDRDDVRPVTVLLWTAPGCHARLRRQSIPTGVQVTLQIYMSGVIYDCTELLKSKDDVSRLDCNPHGLITATLNAPHKIGKKKPGSHCGAGLF